MSRKPRRGDVVELEWLDSEHIALGWAPTADYRRYWCAARRPAEQAAANQPLTARITRYRALMAEHAAEAETGPQERMP